MATERDRHILLEIRQHVGALDPESIIPWAHNGDYTQDSKDDYEKISEALYLTMLKIEQADPAETDELDRLAAIKSTLSNEHETESLLIGVRSLARDKARQRWPHAS